MALALVMVITMTGVGYAAGSTETIESATSSSAHDVIINVTPAESAEVISVDIEWDDLTFEYTGANKLWNPTTHKDDFKGGSGSWDGPKNIKVTNHSNIAVTATGNLAKGSATDGVTAALGNNTFTLDSGVGKVPGSAANKTMTVSVSGTPTAAQSSKVIDNVTVAISK